MRQKFAKRFLATLLTGLITIAPIMGNEAYAGQFTLEYPDVTMPTGVAVSETGTAYIADTQSGKLLLVPMNANGFGYILSEEFGSWDALKAYWGATGDCTPANVEVVLDRIKAQKSFWNVDSDARIFELAGFSSADAQKLATAFYNGRVGVVQTIYDDAVQDEINASAATQTQQVAQTDTEAAATAALAALLSSNSYTVQKNDCLVKIAREQLGDASRYNEIYELNKDHIKNINLIYTGQVVVLPAK